MKQIHKLDDDAKQAAQGLLPRHCLGGLYRYLEYGIPPGDFLTAVISNDLRGSFERADTENAHFIRDYVRWLYNHAPLESWGSPGRFDSWIALGAQAVKEES